MGEEGGERERVGSGGKCRASEIGDRKLTFLEEMSRSRGTRRQQTH